MRTNFYTNTATKPAPSFGQLNQCGGSYYILKRVLQADEFEELEKLTAKQVNSLVDVNLYQVKEYSNKLRAELIPNSEFLGFRTMKQKFFESTMSFINRCCDEADRLNGIIVRSREKYPEGNIV